MEVDWAAEVASARRLRDDLQVRVARRAEQLSRFSKKAREEMGGAGDHVLASRSEKLREEWVQAPADRGGDVTGAGARLARRLPVHQGTG